MEIKKPNLNPVNAWQMILIVLSILFALITGASFFLISSPYAPLYVLAGIAAVIALITWLKKPIWALYFTVFIVLIPIGLISDQVNSYIGRIATVIAFVVWVIDVIRRRRRIHLTNSALLMLLFLVWAVISLIWALYFSEGLTILQKYVLRLILLLILFVNEIRTKKDLEGLMNTLALSGGLLVVVSLATIFLQGYTSGTRLQVLGENENSLGISLLITLPGVLWWTLRSTKRSSAPKKWLAVIFLLTSIGLIGLSGSRGSIISLGLTLLAFLIWKPTRSWGILGLMTIGLALIVAPIVFSTTIARFLGQTGETILGGRESLWSAALMIIKDHPLFGIGIGNSRYQVISYFTNLGLYKSLPESVSLHNPLLVIWAETGIVGLMLYLGVLASAVLSFIRQYLQSRRIGGQYIMSYYALVASVFLGYMASWIKGGGMESDLSYFLMLALLIVPSNLKEISQL
jgi:O-antigen ligase